MNHPFGRFFHKQESLEVPQPEHHWSIGDSQLANYVRNSLSASADDLKMDVTFSELLTLIKKNPRYFHKLRCRPGEMCGHLPQMANLGSLAYVKGKAPEDAVRLLKHALEVIPQGPWIENIFFCIRANGKTYAILDDTSHVKSVLKVRDKPNLFLVSFSLGRDRKPRSISELISDEDVYSLYPKKLLDDKTIVDMHEKKVVQ